MNILDFDCLALKSSEIICLFGILVVSFFKFGLGTFLALNLKFNIYYLITANLIGGISSTIFFTFFGDYITKMWFSNKFKNKKPKIHTKWNKFLIKLKRKIGLLGISIITPLFLSVPIGIVLSLLITKNRYKIIRYISLSCIIWTFILYLLKYNFDFDINILKTFKLN